jgi:hypothetical protein
MIAMELAGGSGIMVAFLIALFFGLVYTLCTAAGSAISQRPYAKRYGGAPGAIGKSNVTGRDELVTVRNWSRGAR